MSPKRLASFVALSLFAQPVLAQQTATSAPQSSAQAVTLLQNSLDALTGGKSIADVTLSGNVRRIAGSNDESGSGTLKAIAGDAARIDLSLPSGQRSEILNGTTVPPAGAWSGSDRVSHPIAYHNLLIDSAWFFPAFAVGQFLASGNYIISYVGQETRGGQSVQHLTAYQSSTVQTPPGTPSFSHLTQMDLYLDSSTLLPATLDFNVHPDNDMGRDIPVEIRFSDYRTVNGLQIPFHIQKFLNNSLLLDFQAQTVTPNSGLSSTAFNSL